MSLRRDLSLREFRLELQLDRLQSAQGVLGMFSGLGEIGNISVKADCSDGRGQCWLSGYIGKR